MIREFIRRARRVVIGLTVCAVGMLVLSSVAYVAIAQTTHDDAHTFNAGITIGSPWVATLTTNFQGVGASTCKDSAAITVTGAAANDGCVIGPNATAGALNLDFSCYVDAANSAKIHLCNPTTSAITGMASGAYKVRILR